MKTNNSGLWECFDRTAKSTQGEIGLGQQFQEPALQLQPWLWRHRGGL